MAATTRLTARQATKINQAVRALHPPTRTRTSPTTFVTYVTLIARAHANHNRKWTVMASHHVAPSRVSVTDLAPVRVHVWRVLTLLAVLAGVLALILIVLTGAA
ncbi:hypothetical protein GCM10022231_13090 [Gordonia caeni]|uniref:Uncharacterized protein n=1 Tax=Gordonia caeni TaxID=1007097 RepID=A0ABP7NWW8_9ACTN